MKKIISVVLSVLMAFSLTVTAFSANDSVNYLLLGDSITEGFGILNPDEASYGKIVADTNGYNYFNQSRMARDSSDLLYLINNSYSIRNDVIKADIISLSIGANDYLANDDVVMLVIGALLGINNKTMDEIAENYYSNLCSIIDLIYELNPDVTILLQYVYSAWTGFAKRAFDAGADRVNAVIDRYAAENPGRIIISDISPAMTGHKENLADDCVHPNAKGNIAIAEIVLKQLFDLKLGTETVPVVKCDGVDYNYFTDYISKDFGWLITVIVKILTGNAVNIIR